MKKNYPLTKAFLALALATSLEVSAQTLSGAYTINSGQATSGSNFQSFTDFATAINLNGISGPVTVNVDPGSGPYNEQVVFTAISGVSAANRVTINGNNRVLYYSASSSSAPQTLLLNGSDFFTVNDLNIEGTGSSYAMVCVLSGGANFNEFDNCTFEAPLNGTFSYQVPFSITGNPNSPTTQGGGEYNSVTSCTMMNGYYGITAYGVSSAPYTQGNSFTKCRITDFYYYGMYCPYAKSLTLKNCTFDRATRSTASTVYGLYNYYNQDGMFDGNKFEKFFAGMTNPSTTCRIIYGYGNPILNGSRNTYKNNIITDMYTNGSIYGMYVPYSGSDVYNNTINMDWPGATSSNLIYAIYGYGNSGTANNFVNNLISIRRGGSGNSRYGMYFALSTNVTADYNNIYVLNGSGNNYLGYFNGAQSSMASWQAAGMDINGYNLDPMYTSTVDLHPTNTSLNNLATDLGILFDQEMAVRHVTTPDIGALEFLTPMCAGTPSMIVAGPTFSLCPGETADMAIGNLNSDLGFSYQWQVSNTSVVGPFTVIPGANSIIHSVPNVTSTTWVSAIITCSAPGGGTIMPVVQVNVAGTTTNTVPYNEGFESIGMDNRLPNCSWFAPDLGGAAKTFTAATGGNLLPNNGSGFAAFMNTGAGTNYYYTNGIWMNANVTYSASVMYQTGMSGATNWTDLSILYGSSQTNTALTNIASVSPAVSPFYKSLSNTFTVPSSGMYYVAIMASNTSGGALNLVWDDLSIIIPCTPQLNTPVLSLSTGANLICSGESVVIQASGADTYSWSTGATGVSMMDLPQVNTVYYVTGTNTLTGCSATMMQAITVKPSPELAVFALPPVICSGKQTNLQASGAATYTWSSSGNPQGSNINVAPPLGTAVFTVGGTGSNGCTASNTVQVTVLANPNVMSLTGDQIICRDDQLILTGTGATNYEWVSTSPAIVLHGSPVYTRLNTTTSFTLKGTDVNGCSGTAIVAIEVLDCTGLSELDREAGFLLYPNPSNGQFTIELKSDNEAMIIVSDIAGRILAAETGSGQYRQMDISLFASGIYYVKVVSGESASVVKIIKN